MQHLPSFRIPAPAPEQQNSGQQMDVLSRGVSPILLFPTLVASTQLLRGTTRKHRHTESYPEHMPVKLPSFWVHTGRDAQSEYARIDKQPSEVWVLVLFGSTEDQTQYCSCQTNVLPLSPTLVPEMGLKFGLKNWDLQGLVPLSGSLLLCTVKASAVAVLQPAARARRMQRGKMAGRSIRLWGEGTGREAGKDQQANQILEVGNAPLPILSFGGSGSSKVFPSLVRLAGSPGGYGSAGGRIPGKGERWKERTPPQAAGCAGGQIAAPSCLLFPLQYLFRPVSPAPPRPPHIFHLAPSGCPSAQVLLSNKGTWNHRNWVRPRRRIGQASAACRSLGARGPSAS